MMSTGVWAYSWSGRVRAYCRPGWVQRSSSHAQGFKGPGGRPGFGRGPDSGGGPGSGEGLGLLKVGSGKEPKANSGEGLKVSSSGQVCGGVEVGVVGMSAGGVGVGVVGRSAGGVALWFERLVGNVSRFVS